MTKGTPARKTAVFQPIKTILSKNVAEERERADADNLVMQIISHQFNPVSWELMIGSLLIEKLYCIYVHTGPYGICMHTVSYRSNKINSFTINNLQ